MTVSHVWPVTTKAQNENKPQSYLILQLVEEYSTIRGARSPHVFKRADGVAKSLNDDDLRVRDCVL